MKLFEQWQENKESLLDGMTVDQTAGQLSVSVQTARTHVRRIYAKLGVSNREQLFAAA